MLKNYKVFSLIIVACAFLSSVQTADAITATWTAETDPGIKRWQSVDSSSDGSIITAGAYTANTVLHTSANSGSTWATSTQTSGAFWLDIAMSDDGVKQAAVSDNDNTIYISTTTGATWATSTTIVASGEFVRRIDSSSDGLKLYTVVDGPIYRSTNGGTTWATTTVAGVDKDLTDVTTSSNGTKVAVTEDLDGYIYTSTDSGLTWATSSSPRRYWKRIESSTDGVNLVAIGGLNGSSARYVFTSSDSGSTWATSTTLAAGNWEALAISSDANVILVGNSAPGYLNISTDGGATWTEQTSAGSRDWRGAAMSSDGTKLIAAAYGTLASSNAFLYTAEIDLTGPVITSLTATPSDTTAVITWTTDESATSSVSYGITGSYGSASTSAVASTSHSLTLTNLASCTYYLYQASSTDVSANVGTTTGNFSTTGCAEVQSGGSSNSGGGSSSNDDDEDEDEDNDSDEDEESSDNNSDEEENTKLDELQKVIDSLVAQIKAIMEARGLSFTAPSAAAGMNANENASFNRDLEMGSTGDDVKLLQKYLNNNGFTVSLSGAGSMGSETTLFGAGTKAALIKFQQANGITPASGYFGPKTRAMVK